MRWAACWRWECCSTRWANAPTWSPPTDSNHLSRACRSADIHSLRHARPWPLRRGDAAGVRRTGSRQAARPGEFFLINIDHHISGREFAHLNWIDRDAASVGELVYRLVKAAGAAVTPEMATCLYTTVLTDTGRFLLRIHQRRYIRAGAGTDAGRGRSRAHCPGVCFSTPTSKMLLLGAALGNLKREGRLAWLWVTHDDMVRACAVDRGLRRHCELCAYASPGWRQRRFCASCLSGKSG
jgi:hypothetical protein